MLADVALPDDVGDKLGFKPFADAIAGIIDSPNTATPLVMAINARWGAGKTTLGQMVKRRLETKSAADGHAPHVTCWFGAWMHDDAPALSTALAAEIAQVASRSRVFWRRIVSPLPSSLSTAGERKLRKGFFYLAWLVLIVLVVFVVALRNGYGLSAAAKLDPELVKIVTTLKGSTYFVGLIVLALIVLCQVLAAVLPVAKSVGEFAKDPQFAAKTASMPEVRCQLGKLIRQATPGGSKFVIFIDDLDRCRLPRSVDILEAVNQLLDHSGIVVLLMSDMQVVAKCAEIKYKELATSETSVTNQLSRPFSTYGWNFLQKIIQLQFDLPVYPARTIRELVEDLAKEVPENRTTGRLEAGWRAVRAKCGRLLSGLRTPSDTILLTFTFLLAIFVFLVIWKLRGHATPLRFQRLSIFAVGMTAATVVTYVAGLAIRIFVRMRESSRRRRIDEQIRSRIRAGERDFSQVEAYVRRENSALPNDPRTEGLVRERLQRYLEDESELQREAEDEVMRHLEPMPRHAKRLLNRLRLLLFIAHERKMFGGKPELTARHIGKWAVLGERWPELSQAVCLDPQVMERLETTEDHDSVIRERAPHYANDKALRRFCLSRAGVRLSRVVGRIVEFASSAREK